MASNIPSQTYADAARQAGVANSAAHSDTTSASNGGSVALPSRKSGATTGGKSSVWAVSEAAPASQPPNVPAPANPLNECDKHNRPQAVCCRELKGDDERHLIDPDIVRDVIIGLSDGLTVPFGLTAGLSSLGSSKLVVVGGLAELVSGAISMGVGGFLSAQAERDHFRYMQRTTRDRVARSCAGEMEREVHEVLGPLGLDQSISRRVAGALLKVEDSVAAPTERPNPDSFFRSCLKWVARQPRSTMNGGGDGEAGKLRWSDDVGMTAFLLKLGQGMEEVPQSRMWISAVTIGLSYFVGGLVPLFPYFFEKSAMVALYWSIGVMAVVLTIFGAVKAYFTGAKIGPTGYLKASFSTIVIGGGAAAASWLIVKALESP